MMLCSLMRVASLVTLQPVLSGRAFFGACVCCRVSTRVVQTCAVTCHRPSTTHPSPPPTLEERGGRMQVRADQGHSYKGQLVRLYTLGNVRPHISRLYGGVVPLGVPSDRKCPPSAEKSPLGLQAVTDGDVPVSLTCSARERPGTDREERVPSTNRG